jgi:hypothetical protein
MNKKYFLFLICLSIIIAFLLILCKEENKKEASENWEEESLLISNIPKKYKANPPVKIELEPSKITPSVK